MTDHDQHWGTVGPDEPWSAAAASDWDSPSAQRWRVRHPSAWQTPPVAPRANVSDLHPRRAPRDDAWEQDDAPDASGFEAGSAPGRAASIVHMAGAVASLALVVGIVSWGYSVIARDVSGVPVVQALEGPMRIAPEKPGGQLADHQGLAVNRIAGDGTAAGPADRVVLAGRPAGLSAEDVAHGILAEVAESDPAPDPTLPAEAGTVEAVIPPDSPLAQGGAPQVVSLVSQLTDGTAESDAAPLGLSPLAAAPDDAAAQALATEGAELQDAATVFADGIAPVRSLRPQTRDGMRGIAVPVVQDPIAAAILAAGASGPAQAAPTTSEVDPDTLPAGTRLVQIGAFDSPETARAEWARLVPRLGAYLQDKDRVIQRASSGGRTFYRLRAHGFSDLPDARRFCAAFTAEGVDCIPVVTR